MNKKRGFSVLIIFLSGIFVIIALVVAVLFFGTSVLGKGIATYTSTENTTKRINKIPPTVEHIAKPKAVRAIYMSQCAASSDTFRKRLIDLADETEINSFIIDVKDFTGTVSFPSKNRENIPKGNGCRVNDMKEFIKKLHDKGIYVIGRITVFQDPLYTSIYPNLAVQSKSKGGPWKDYKGLSFVDVGAKQFWDYIVEISNEAHAIGFDELNYDYIRFPSDGPMSDVKFNHSNYNQRALELEKFFRYFSPRVKKADANGHILILSADLFGMTTTNSDDLTIGQVLERATPYFDYIDPMVYPSHYPNGFHGYKNPNDNVYGVVKYSLDRAVERLAATTTKIASLAYTRIGTSTPAIYSKPSRSPNVLRPWLQDFNYGGEYGPKKVRAQIQAVYDAGLNSWMLWDPRNRYTRAALKTK